jgi:hypothetical protein
VLDSRLLKRVCGPNREEMVGDRRKFHNEEIVNVYPAPYIIRKMN